MPRLLRLATPARGRLRPELYRVGRAIGHSRKGINVAYTPLYGSNPCPSCGNTNRHGARFCDACGTVLSSEPASGLQPLRDGELKYLTVLFGDIVGSTEMVAG